MCIGPVCADGDSEVITMLRGSAVVDCLTRDRGDVGLSLTGITALCP